MIVIGKEEYVEVMMSAYNKLVFAQCYLHENIHRLQGIYKLLYGGYIQPIQALLGMKKIKLDPTKGSWSDHEYLAKIILFAIERIRMENFMLLTGKVIIEDYERQGKEDSDTDCVQSCIDFIWYFQEQYELFFCLGRTNSVCVKF